MIKFFHNIRKKLAAENKVLPYMRYAIGEIVLVVIGILIALQVNTYHQSLIDSNTEITYLKGIYDDLNSQILDIEESMTMSKHYISTVNKLLDDYVANDGFKGNDSLIYQINNIASVANPSEIKTSFTELLYSGDIGLIRNDSLRKNIVKFYQELEKMITTSKVNIENIFQDKLYPIIYNRTLMLTPGNYTNLASDLNSYFPKRNYSQRTKALVYKKMENEETEIEFVNALNIKLIIEALQLERSKTIIQSAKKLIKEVEEEALNEHHMVLKKSTEDD